MVHQPVPLLASPAGFDLCSDSKPLAFAPTTADSHYFPPSPISESGLSQTKPIAEQSSHFELQYQPRRGSEEGYNQSPGGGLQIHYSELNHEADGYDERGGRVEDEQFERVGGGEGCRGGVEGHRVGLGEASPVDYPGCPDYCTPLVIKVIVLIMLPRIEDDGGVIILIPNGDMVAPRRRLGGSLKFI